MNILNIKTLKKDDIKHLINNFKQTGAIVVQGLSLDENEFEEFSKYFCKSFAYLSSRNGLYLSSGDRFTSKTFQENFGILAHCEGAYMPYTNIPDIGLLMCVNIENNKTGETFLVDGVEMLNDLPNNLKNKFINEKVIYEFLWEKDRYKKQFNVSNKSELISLLNTLENVKFDFINDDLHMLYTTTAVKKLNSDEYAISNGVLSHLPNIIHPNYIQKNNFKVLTNQVYWENMVAFSDDEINYMINSQDKLKIKYRWNKGDILIFDNFKFMHGRESNVEKSERVILSRFGYN